MHVTDSLILTSTALAAAAGLSIASHATFSPRSTLWGPVITRAIIPGARRVALTFDDGPTAGATDRILDILSEFNVKAAFFVVGRNVRREPALLRRIDREEHLIGNHSFDHSHFGSMGRRKFWQAQIDQTDDAIAQVIGRRPVMFRPPMGHKTPYVVNAAKRRGHAIVAWSVNGRDSFTTTSEKIVSNVVPRSGPGDIVLLHDGVEPHSRRDPQPTAAALRPILLGLRQKEFELVRLDDLLNMPSAIS